MLDFMNIIIPKRIVLCRKCNGVGCSSCKKSGYHITFICPSCRTKLRKNMNRYYCNECRDIFPIADQYTTGQIWT